MCAVISGPDQLRAEQLVREGLPMPEAHTSGQAKHEENRVPSEVCFRAIAMPSPGTEIWSMCASLS